MDDESVPLIGDQKARGSSIQGHDNVAVIDESNSSSGTSWYASVFLVINAALGAGLLEFPYSFSQSGGVAAALIVQAVLIAFIVGSLFLLAYCSELKQSNTFPSTIRTICGKPAEIISSICIIFYTYGTCVTFLIVINDQLSQLFYFITKNLNFCHHWYMSEDFTLTVSCVVFILPLCFSKRIDFLKYASFAGVAAVLYVVVLIIVRYADPIDPNAKGHISTSPSSFMDVFLVIPTVCFSYQCHVSIIPIYSCMKQRNTKNFAKTVLLAISVCLFAYSVSATLGYYTFGDNVSQDILKSYKPPSADVMIGVFMIAAKTYTTYPILLFCGRIEVEKLVGYAMKTTDGVSERHGLIRRCTISVVWFTSSLLIALYVPNIAVVIDVLGALAAMFIFFFPGMCLMKLAADYIPHDRKLKRNSMIVCATFFMVIGMFLFGLVSVQAIMDDVNSKEPKGINNNTCV